jgi:hypothetical protein
VGIIENPKWSLVSVTEIVPVKVHPAYSTKTGKLDRSGPMVIYDFAKEHWGYCDPAPELLDQIKDGERFAYFEGKWDRGRWLLGQRLDNQHW